LNRSHDGTGVRDGRCESGFRINALPEHAAPTRIESDGFKGARGLFFQGKPPTWHGIIRRISFGSCVSSVGTICHVVI
jgi:hypothetical protein